MRQQALCMSIMLAPALKFYLQCPQLCLYLGQFAVYRLDIGIEAVNKLFLFLYLCGQSRELSQLSVNVFLR